jgi:hypothetical protein
VEDVEASLETARSVSPDSAMDPGNAEVGVLSQRVTVFMEPAHRPTRANALLAGQLLPMLLQRLYDVLSAGKGGILTILQGTVSVSPTSIVPPPVNFRD